MQATTSTSTGATLPGMAKTEPKLYVVNMTFDGGTYGEVITADPRLVEDWVDAQFITEIDEGGNRIVTTGPRGKAVVDEDAPPVVMPQDGPRPITPDDKPPAE